MKEKNRKISGYICLVLGGIFLLAGIVLFIMSNWVNLYAEKTSAMIVSQYDVKNSNGEYYKMLDVVYRVRDNVISTTMEYYGELEPDTVTLDIYYNMKNPKMVLNGGWTFWPLLISFLGVIIAIPGLSFLGIIGIELFESRGISDNATERNKNLALYKEKIENNGLPFLGAAGMLIFGIVMVIVDPHWYVWIFIVAGAIIAVYFAIELIPAVISWVKLKKVPDLKIVVSDTNLDEEALDQIDKDNKTDDIKNEE